MAERVWSGLLPDLNPGGNAAIVRRERADSPLGNCTAARDAHDNKRRSYDRGGAKEQSPPDETPAPQDDQQENGQQRPHQPRTASERGDRGEQHETERYITDEPPPPLRLPRGQHYPERQREEKVPAKEIGVAPGGEGAPRPSCRVQPCRPVHAECLDDPVSRHDGSHNSPRTDKRHHSTPVGYLRREKAPHCVSEQSEKPLPVKPRADVGEIRVGTSERGDDREQSESSKRPPFRRPPHPARVDGFGEGPCGDAHPCQHDDEHRPRKLRLIDSKGVGPDAQDCRVQTHKWKNRYRREDAPLCDRSHRAHETPGALVGHRGFHAANPATAPPRGRPLRSCPPSSAAAWCHRRCRVCASRRPARTRSLRRARLPPRA